MTFGPLLSWLWISVAVFAAASQDEYKSKEELQKILDSENRDSQSSPGNDVVGDNEGNGESDTGSAGSDPVRRKRFIENVNKLWQKGIIPFTYTDELTARDKFHAIVGMRFVSDYSCIDFVPHTSNTSTDNGLNHDGHVRFHTAAGRCDTHVGNHGFGYNCHCCQAMDCVHELGHVLGFLHEQRSAERDGWIRIHLKNVTRDRWRAYTRELEGNQLYFDKQYFGGFDLSTPMAYRPSYEGSNHAYAILFPELLGALGVRVFYFFKEMAFAYNCKEKSCQHFTMTCHNEGYVTRVKGQCQCVCIGRLDPETGCTTMLQSYEAPTEFPGGQYALLAPATDCPETFPNGQQSYQFYTGTLTHYFTKVWHYWPLQLKGIYSGGVAEQHFCLRDSADNGVYWPPGPYCILRVGGTCPFGFHEEGFIEYDNADTPGLFTEWSGAVPDGEFGPQVRMEFCCRNDGFDDHEPLVLPNTRPFVLFPYVRCAQVRGMLAEMNWFVLHHVPNSGVTQRSPHPYVLHYSTSGQLYVPYCHYTPLITDCGGILEVDETTRTVDFTSPYFPNDYHNAMECQWFIKGPEKSTLILTFEDFDIEVDGNKKCRDELLINHARVGQAPIKYCGEKQPGSIRSITNLMMVTLKTSRTGTRRGFHATVIVALEDEHCFDPTDKGVNYRGTVNFTRNSEPCQPWSEVAHCLHSAYNGGDYYDGLEENYCRNPGNGWRPWCYIEAEHCDRNYCDVCLLEEQYDKWPDCEALEAEGLCSDQYLATKGCPHTCRHHLVQPDVPGPYVQVTCPAPVPPEDALEPSSLQASYPVGSEVFFFCSSSPNQDIVTRCLGDGTWSPMGYACGGCLVDWVSYNKMCYRVFYSVKSHGDAQAQCRVYGEDSNLATPVEDGVVTFLSKQRNDQNAYWIGLNETGTLNNWRWLNGSEPLETRWAEGQPSVNQKLNCAAMDQDDYWTSRTCTDKRPFICQMKFKERAVCTDKRPDCEQLVSQSPSHCTDHTDHAWLMCPLTCGLCHPPPVCPVGWETHGDSCFHFPAYPNNKLKYGQATTFCRDLGAILAPASSQEEAQLVSDVARAKFDRKLVWLGGDDLKEEGLWIWQNGEPVTYTNWARSEPNNLQNGKEANCMIMRYSGKWADNICNKRRFYFCKKITECFLPSPTANAEISSQNNTQLLPVGKSVTYSCQDGYLPTSGDAVRTCLPSQTLTGSDLICDTAENVLTESSQVRLIDRRHMGEEKRSYTGPSRSLRVSRDGHVHAWSFYSRTTSSVTFQVYRHLESNRYELIGENTVQTKANRIQRVNIELQQRIPVQTGDLLGIFYNSDSGPVPFEDCTEFPKPEGEGVMMSSSTLGDPAHHTQGAEITFDSSTSCLLFSFRALIGN